MHTNYPKPNLSIKCWAEDDRPREKMLMKGIHNLSKAELLAIILGSGSKKQSAVDLAKEILYAYKGKLDKLERASIKDLQKFKGVGPVKAINLKAALEFARRVQREQAETVKFSSPNEVFKLMQPILASLNNEEFWVLYLNQSNLLIHKQRISSGGLTATVVDSRLIFKLAFEHSSTSVILCHNHPSGNLSPSQADKDITNTLVKAGNLLNIAVLDHLIVTNKGYFSFNEEGLM